MKHFCIGRLGTWIFFRLFCKDSALTFGNWQHFFQDLTTRRRKSCCFQSKTNFGRTKKKFNKSRFHARNNFIFYSIPASLFLLLFFYKIFDFLFVSLLLFFFFLTPPLVTLEKSSFKNQKGLGDNCSTVAVMRRIF